MRLFRRASKKKKFEFVCAKCGERHSGSPSFSYKYPSIFFDVPENERDARVIVNDDLCCIRPSDGNPDGSIFYEIRVTLSIPIKGVDEPFLWGVWVSQSEDSYKDYANTFSEDQTGKGSFGWLEVTMPYYNASASDEPRKHLECDVNWGGQSERPKIELWEDPHQLVVDQKNGIDWETAIKIAEMTMHP